MLSILIPIYNYDVTKLCTKLIQLCESAAIPFEIRLMDDASDLHFKQLNAPLSNLEPVHYTELRNNIGRSKIRNRLAAEAQFDTLLFIDSDMYPPTTRDFIQNYLPEIAKEQVVFGGLIYSNDRPKDKNKCLRWKYGVEREALSAKDRERKPWVALKTCNLLIRKSVFESIKFDENFKGYGYEDTLFGIELQKKNIPVKHIDNPLQHLGLEDTKLFLKKTQEAMQNLARLLKNPDLSEYLQEMKIVKYYRLEKRLKIDKLSAMNQRAFNPLILKNLQSRNPNMRLFDFYKLASLINAMES